MQVNSDTERIIEDSKFPSETKEALNFTLDKMKAFNIVPTDVQVTILTNHIAEMVARSKSGEKLMDVDPTMFDEVSTEAMTIADDLVKHIGNLAVSEKYVVSIHFETAKNN
ncbi:hypothetical protein LOOC260_105730 [Paucilactobacillus hokkaidonensis JCM 18461]|uniref:PRD domain-containing protein n=2 Tax=Paucilactobacillus hokkaidonensis TaxID=1193095 RepID=A0A0A1GT56_9LACO|nr:hypothetical protein [Paucilactobacillus hokkaidonensis]KRO11320.1 hypothetical protein IV59_GL000058 [Paucilactobacillus hokkaidonensis]BAP85130.1 hypothetical protein LOOC260_105730 [Paucilactobacillus hokkaidonensis JCM 18461]